MRDRIYCVGDSITEGFNDGGLNDQVPYTMVSCLGYPGRLTHVAVATPSANLPYYVNLGQSGSLVSEYFIRAKGIINADPTKITSCIFSVWSPNTTTPGNPSEAFEQTTLNNIRVLVDDFHDFLVSKSIIPIPCFLFASPYGAIPEQFIRLKNHVDSIMSAYPYGLYPGAISNTNGGTASDVYISSYYYGAPTSDATHPQENDGYAILANYIGNNYNTKKQLAATTLGFL